MMKKLLAAALAAVIGAAGFALAQNVFPLVTQITGNEYLQNLGVGTAQYFQSKQIIGGFLYAGPHGTATPVLTSCGTSPAITGTDAGGVITFGTGSPTGCTMTFSTAYKSAPICSVDWLTSLSSFTATISATAITLTQTGTSSDLVTYICFPQSGG